MTILNIFGLVVWVFMLFDAINRTANSIPIDPCAHICSVVICILYFLLKICVR